MPSPDNKRRIAERNYRKANPVTTKTAAMMRDARRRAKDKKLPLDIDLDYVRSIVTNICPIFGTPLDWSCGRSDIPSPVANSPSLDRIDPSKGYIKNNVWIISHRANQIKSDASHEELKLVTKAVGEAIVNSLEF